MKSLKESFSVLIGFVTSTWVWSLELRNNNLVAFLLYTGGNGAIIGELCDKNFTYLEQISSFYQRIVFKFVFFLELHWIYSLIMLFL